MKRIAVGFLAIILTCGCSPILKKTGSIFSKKLEETSKNTLSKSGQYKEGLRLYSKILLLIKNNFYEDVDLVDCSGKIFKNGVTNCTDPYSYYLNNQETKEEESELLKGEIFGIGVQILARHEDSAIIISGVEENSPAQRSGLLPGDEIVAISTADPHANWISIEGLPINSVVNLIRGPVGTKVTIKIIRKKEEKDFAVVREKIQIKFLSSKKINGIGYIKINQFGGGNLVSDFYEAVSGFKKEKVNTLIIDLRFNGGGLLSSVLEIASLFSKNQNDPVLFTKTRDGPYDLHLGTARQASEFKNFNLVVLQNRFSASASEILSGYLKECGAIVVGNKSFGKGIVQNLFSLGEYGELHLTVAEYFIGKNLVKVHKIGISPTIEIENPKTVKSEKDDLQLKKALEEAEKLSKLSDSK